MTDCLTPAELEKLASGLLSAAGAQRATAHLEQCASCGQNLQEFRANAAYLEKVKGVLEDGGGSFDQETRPLSATVTAREQAPRRRGGLAAQAHAIPGYELLREIHRGGQGVVYEAMQVSTKRTVAIKMMLRGPFADETSRARFQREVELVAALKHPNIVVIHDSGVAHGGHYFVMDHVQGLRLDEYVGAAERSVREIVEVFVTICDAVAFAHRHGVMHRDLKPSNILVGEDGAPYVLDFGLAKSIAEQDEDRRQATLSESGQVMGTVRYMSPEQTAGEAAAIDIRTDVYSLGIILYELLTGAAPYDTKSDIMTALANIREAIPPRPSRRNKRINSELEAIVLQAIEKNPDRRYQSAGELAQDIRAWLEGRAVAAKSASSLYVVRKLAQRHAFVTIVLSAVVLIILSSLSITTEFYLRANSAQQQREQSDLGAIASEKKAAGYEKATFKAMRQSALAWFLPAWRANRLDEARRYQATVRRGSPEYLAMAFLLDETYSAEQLHRDLPRDAAPLAHLAIGQRELKAGRLREAIEAMSVGYELARDDLLMQAFIGTRLKEARSAVGKTRPVPGR